MENKILSEMTNEKWAMEPAALQLFLNKISQVSQLSVLAGVKIEMPKKMLNIVNGVARINISGVLLKSVPGWLKLWGVDATGYDEIMREINEASTDSKVSAIEMMINSPGGMVSGVEQAADAIYNARQTKTVTAVVDDLAASGAYWLASQANNIIAAGKTAEIGSIGVYSVYYDWTGWDEKMGIKTVVIRSGEHKGMGADMITDAQIAAVQEIIDGLASQFIDAVARGRSKQSQDISKLATGRMWIADAARELGLIDSVANNNKNTNIILGESAMDNTENKLSNEEIQKQIKAESEKTSAAEKKRLADLKAAFPKDLEFAVAQFEAGSDVTQAKANYVPILQARIDAKEQGEEPLKSGNSADVGLDFIAQGKQIAKDEKIPLGMAYKKLAKQNPELHAAYKQSLGL